MYALPTTLGVFTLILVLARFKVPLTAAILIGAVLLGPIFGLSIGETAHALIEGALQPSTLALGGITVLLLALSNTMQAGGQMERIVTLARDLMRRPAVAMATLPALIGLLPMPGGALFSAPMVRTAAGGTKLPGGLLSAVNYWFRHIWEYWWPLYPGVILAMTLTEVELGTFVAYQMPLGISMAVSGTLIFRGTHADLHRAGPRPAPGTKRNLMQATSSIWVILLVWAVATALLRTIDTAALSEGARSVIEKYGPIGTGLLASLAWTARLNRLGRVDLRRIVLKRSMYALGFLVLSVMVFRYMLGVTGAAPRIAQELTALRVPVELVVMFLPFIAGLVTGLAVGFVGTSFPIVLALVNALPGAPWLQPYVVLAYAFGHLGQMMSPLHLCHVMSNRFFETGFTPVYRHILPPAGLTAILAMLYFLLLRGLG